MVKFAKFWWQSKKNTMMALAHTSKVLWKVVCTLYGFEENDFLRFIFFWFFTYYKSRNIRYLLRQIKVDVGSFPLLQDMYLYMQCKKIKVVMQNELICKTIKNTLLGASCTYTVSTIRFWHKVKTWLDQMFWQIYQKLMFRGFLSSGNLC